MAEKSINATIEVAQSVKDVFKAITEAEKWWSKDFEGKSSKLNDEFVIHHPNQHYSKQKLIEVVPDKKIVWLVTDSKLDWLQKDKHEWTNTKMIFEIGIEGAKTVLRFTHEGLTPEKECYDMCEKGWTLIITDWLFHFITIGIPSTDMTKASEIRNKLLNDKKGVDMKNYHRTITVDVTPEEAINKISQVNNWWKHDFSGSTKRVNDKFTVPFSEIDGEKSYVDFVVSEFVPNKKLVWKVTDCNLPWFKDKKEWNNTEVVFEISYENNKTIIEFTHVGLVPSIECYEACEKGWDGHVTNSLLGFINEGKGNPK